MKIKLKTLGFDKLKGYLKQPTDRSDSTTSYADITDALEITEIYFRDKVGVIGGERLGIEHNVWIPYTAIENGNKIQRADLIIINKTEKADVIAQQQTYVYEIVDIMNREDSPFENFYVINVVNRNE